MLAASFSTSSMQAEESANWREVSRNSRGPVFVDTRSLRRDGHRFTIRSRADLTQALDNGTKTMFASFQFDCRARTVMLLDIHFLAADGSTVAQSEVPSDQRRVEPVPSSAPNHAVLQLYCE